MTTLTHENSKALWHAVQAMEDMFAASKELHAEGRLTDVQIITQGQRLERAKVALRKVQAIVRSKP